MNTPMPKKSSNKLQINDSTTSRINSAPNKTPKFNKQLSIPEADDNMEFNNILETFGENSSGRNIGTSPRLNGNNRGNFIYNEDDNYSKHQSNDDKMCYLC